MYKKPKTLLFLTLITTVVCLNASYGPIAPSASFTIETKYKKNKKIWGTYQLAKETVKIKRGFTTWNASTENQLGDVMINKGSIFIVKNSLLDSGIMDMKVSEIPYVKEKDNYLNKNKNLAELNKIYKDKLLQTVEHRDLQDSLINYKDINCRKTKKDIITCQISGDIVPQDNTLSLK